MKLGVKDIAYVGIQFLLLLAYLYDAPFLHFTLPSIVKDVFLGVSLIGIAIGLLSMMQLNIYLSPFPSPKKGSKLVQNGLYKYVRHPIYSGILIALFGYGVYTTSSYRLIISLSLLVLFYYKSKYEEMRLQRNFSDYKSYQRTTGRFFPKL
jgi:protein-S-isoprenylcysteine O-methyltransferase Ste14